MKYPGSKQTIARWIIDHFPSNYRELTYLEPFFGSGCVFFNKEPSQIETINDRDGEVSNLFLQIRENTEQLIFLIEHTPWSRDDFLLSFEKSNDPAEQARRFLVRTWFAIGTNYRNKNSLRMNIGRASGGHECFHLKLPETLRETAKRLKHESKRYVQIENRDALLLIQKYDRPNVLMYLDPPYVAETRRHKKIYQHEMNDMEHEKLLQLISGLQAHVLISGYDCDLYNRYLEGWNKDTNVTNDEAGNKRVECLWFNYNTRQYGLFNE
jgi:DNA adenine methylase